MKVEESYVDGKRNGEAIEYDETGNISRKVIYKNGKLIDNE